MDLSKEDLKALLKLTINGMPRIPGMMLATIQGKLCWIPEGYVHNPGGKMETSNTETTTGQNLLGTLGYCNLLRSMINAPTLSFGEKERAVRYLRKIQNFVESSSSKDSSTPSDAGEPYPHNRHLGMRETAEFSSPAALENLPMKCVAAFMKSAPLKHNPFLDDVLQWESSLTPMQQAKLVEFVATFSDGGSTPST